MPSRNRAQRPASTASEAFLSLRQGLHAADDRHATKRHVGAVHLVARLPNEPFTVVGAVVDRVGHIHTGRHLTKRRVAGAGSTGIQERVGLPIVEEESLVAEFGSLVAPSRSFRAC